MEPSEVPALDPAAVVPPGIAVVTGAAGQDGSFLVETLLGSGWLVHATVRPGGSLGPLARLARTGDQLTIQPIDVTDTPAFRALIEAVRPNELYNLAGVSSVSASFAAPWEAWRTNADAVVMMLEVVRQESPETRFYQSSSSEMFGWAPGASVVHDETSRLAPMSPYGAAKAAAHLLCQSYRRSYGLRVGCGILFNHESSRRPDGFLSRKVVDHVRRLRDMSPDARALEPPLSVGNLDIRRDWGYAPDFIDGIVRINRQVAVRSALSGQPQRDEAGNYRDYVLGTGVLHSVQELIDRAFALAGLGLVWHGSDGTRSTGHADFVDSGERAVICDRSFLRPSDPGAIQADPRVAVEDLGWRPTPGLDRWLMEMLGDG